MTEDSNEKLSIVLFSGTVDKRTAASVITAGAAARGKQVKLFLTVWGLMAFKKGAARTNTRFSKDFEDYAAAATQAKTAPHWLDTLRDAMEVGEVKVKARGLTMDLFDLKLADREPIVSEITGVGSFVEGSSGGQTLFI